MRRKESYYKCDTLRDISTSSYFPRQPWRLTTLDFTRGTLVITTLNDFSFNSQKDAAERNFQISNLLVWRKFFRKTDSQEFT